MPPRFKIKGVAVEQTSTKEKKQENTFNILFGVIKLSFFGQG